jgi:hypothetical protein
MTELLYSAPARAFQDRAERMATATIQIITAKAKTTTTELWLQLVEMYRDELDR